MATSTSPSSDRPPAGAAPPAAEAPLPPPRPRARVITERLGANPALDAPVAAARRVMSVPMSSEPVRRALSGDWLGHPLHPLLTDVVIGSWTSASLLDVTLGRRGADAADRLAAVGVLSAFPTIAAGWHDWMRFADRDSEGARLGVVHAASNAVGLGLWVASLRARRAGARGRGTALGLVAMGAMSVGGYLGSHLSYVHGARVEAGLSDAAGG